MPSNTFQIQSTIGGIAINGTITKAVPGQQGHEVTIPAGKSGSLITRTDDNTAVVQAAASHGIQTGDICGVFWAAGCRLGLSATVSGGDPNEITFDGGSGDVFPAADTDVVVSKFTSIDAAFTGNLVSALVTKAEARAGLVFAQVSDYATLYQQDLTAGVPTVYLAAANVDNPFTDMAIGRVRAYNGSTSANTVQIGISYDSDF